MPATKGRSPKKREPLEAFDQFICLLCPNDDEGHPPQCNGMMALKKHIKETHPELVSEDGRIRGRREFKMHLNFGTHEQCEYDYWQDDTHFASELRQTVRSRR